jgi:hypothetical protein
MELDGPGCSAVILNYIQYREGPMNLRFLPDGPGTR